MRISGIIFHTQADESLVCPHRDLSVCPECASVSVEIVEVFGNHYHIPDAADRAAFKSEVSR